MSKKDQFLRAVQRVDPRSPHDLPLTFRWALNLRERAIPRDVESAAKKFITLVSR
ncbi:MAG TPA: hypothetical protein VH413_18835 [Verrucomicrobiae bacterium]|jgi:hypothetical protein|nr:hypothetical protein [Verrucomicrobiae bacterium]